MTARPGNQRRQKHLRMSGFSRLSVSFYLLQFFLETPAFVDGRRINIQKRYTKNQVCKETTHTVTNVQNCPLDDNSFQERVQAKQCEKVNHSSCSDEIFVYHCVRFRENLVELCAPRGLITGGCCAQFNEGVGRVIEDYNVLCSECPLNYYTNETCKYPSCVKPRTIATETSISQLPNETSIPKVSTAKISTTNKIDCSTSERSKRHARCILNRKNSVQSIEATSISTSSASNGNTGTRPIRVTTSFLYIIIAVTVVIVIIISSLMLYYSRKRSFKFCICIASKENTKNVEWMDPEREKLEVSNKVYAVKEIADLKN
ncbi:uncharacterized protein LOC134268879 [Saccostrea cucullata]|uniref:uncharacterized protein LOC134268879 n=1 Tax=Saccostrea cuccullata TaxID=36930 RepID=UPI002ED2D491